MDQNLAEQKLTEFEGYLKSFEEIFIKTGRKLKREPRAYDPNEVVLISSDDEPSSQSQLSEFQSSSGTTHKSETIKGSCNGDQLLAVNEDHSEVVIEIVSDDSTAALNTSSYAPDCTDGNTSSSTTGGRKKKKSKKKKKRERAEELPSDICEVSNNVIPFKEKKKKRKKNKTLSSNKSFVQETTKTDIESLRRELFVKKLIEVILPDVLAEQKNVDLPEGKKRKSL